MKMLVLLLLAVPLSAAGQLPAKCFDFGSFPAKPFHGSFVPPKLQKGSPGHRFRTVIKRGAAGPPDFAGHYRVVTWGCGTNCINFAIVDKKTGEVYMQKASASMELKHVATSKLLVTDPPEISKAYVFEPVSYIWNEKDHELRILPGCNGYAQQGASADRPTAAQSVGG